MNQEDLNALMRNPWEAAKKPRPQPLPECPQCGERYCGDGIAFCTECANTVTPNNGIRDDDRFENLREATNRENLNNLGVHRNGNLPGASFNKRDRRWQAQIQVNGKKKLIGYFGTKEEAHKAYIAVKNSITQHFGD